MIKVLNLKNKFNKEKEKIVNPGKSNMNYRKFIVFSFIININLIVISWDPQKLLSPNTPFKPPQTANRGGCHRNDFERASMCLNSPRQKYTKREWKRPADTSNKGANDYWGGENQIGGHYNNKLEDLFGICRVCFQTSEGENLSITILIPPNDEWGKC